MDIKYLHLCICVLKQYLLIMKVYYLQLNRTNFLEIGNLKGVDDKYINIINADISDNIDLSIAMNTLKDENYWRKCCVKGRVLIYNYNYIINIEMGEL